MKSSTEKYMSMELKKFHNKILKPMKTFGVTIDHILVHFIGSKLWLYVFFRIPLYMYQAPFLIKQKTKENREKTKKNKVLFLVDSTASASYILVNQLD